MRTTMNLQSFSWPLSELGQAMTHLARRAALEPREGAVVTLPAAVATGPASEFTRWVAWAGEQLGVETEPVDVTAGSVDALIMGAGPAVLQYVSDEGARVLLLVSSRRGRARLLCPDLRVRSCAPDALRALLCAAHVAPLAAELDRLVAVAGIPASREAAVRDLIARERLGATSIARAWLLKVPATAGVWRQLRDERIPQRLAAMLGLFALLFTLEILAWRIIGASALDGRLDRGWLAGWALLVLSVTPLRLLGGWLDATLALDLSRLLKARLLVGALHLDVESVRHQGAGQLLGRVMESQAFESLALNFGLGSLVAMLELGFAAAVMAAGASPALHLALLGGWLAAAAGLGVRYYGRLKHWSAHRLDLTHDLVERMVGHRTTLVQESAERRDQEQDAAMTAYASRSAALDAAGLPLLAALPGGWLLVGLAGLAPAFIAGHTTPSSLAVSIGGVLLAARAMASVSAGLASASGAIVAWMQIAPLFEAARRPSPRPARFVGAHEMTSPAGARPSPLLEADNLSFRYQPGEEPVLQRASLTVRHGERLLIEGPSGGGKSTLASLLVGLREPDSGMLLLNGLDRFTLGDSWHQFATEAPQFHENHVMTGTLGFNLLMGRNWPATDDELAEATDLCRELGLGDLLARMPAGMMQAVGETGWQLSHGERSRLFLARALLQGAELTVLDESFAALDPESLETCLATVLRRTKTLAVIAHP